MRWYVARLRGRKRTIVSNLTCVLMAGINSVENQSRTARKAAPVPYNGRVPFAVHDFQPSDFDTLWRIDQTCFAPGIAYSRDELRLYMRRRSAFTLVAHRVEGKSAEKKGVEGNATEEDNAASEREKLSGLTDFVIAGFIVAEAGARERGHIITIDVIAAARRFGVGSLLLRAAEDRLISTGCRAVELETAVDNVSALAFYKRHRYTVIKTFPRYYSNGVDALVLERKLV
jgi:[ribosomal protein S18]-alanine N-acetyltransferase